MLRDRHLASGDPRRESAPLSQSRASLLVDLPRDEMAPPPKLRTNARERRPFDTAALDVLLHPQREERYRHRIEQLERLLEGSEQEEASRSPAR
jgi:hypothetical protein